MLAGATWAGPPRIGWQYGPRTVTLGVGVLELPAGMMSAQQEALKTFLTATGNPPAGDEVAVVAPLDLDWFLVFSYDRFASVGVTAAEPSVDDIVAAMRRGGHEANQARRRAGRETLDLLGWRDKPRYDERTHRLEWSVAAVESGGRRNTNRYWIYLTRTGFLIVELVTEQEFEPRAHAQASVLLERVRIAEQEQYVEPGTRDWLLIGFGALALVLPLAGFGAVWWMARRRRSGGAAG
jgi:uncharacterized membrane-anchored protein